VGRGGVSVADGGDTVGGNNDIVAVGVAVDEAGDTRDGDGDKDGEGVGD